MKNLPQNSVLFDGQYYKTDITLINTHGSIPLPPGIVRSLVIYDNLYTIFYTGRLVVNSSDNMLEGLAFHGSNELKERISTNSYVFNDDSKDHIIIDIVPITEQGEDEKLFPSRVYRMKYLFSIHSEDEYVHGDDNEKTKIYYLRDARAQSLHQSNIQWSTAHGVLQRYSSNLSVSHTGNRLRSIKTGRAIRNFISAALPTFTNTFADDWDWGHNDIFYTSSTQSTAYDDLEALLDTHVSSVDKDNCILRFDQRRDRWTLKSYHDMFEAVVNKNNDTFGSAVTDMFNIHSMGSPKKAPNKLDSGVMTEFDAESPTAQELQGMTAFQYLNMATDDSVNELVTTLVHSYDSSQKQFAIDCTSNQVNKIKEKFQTLYAEPMVGNPPTAIFPVNEEKIENIIRANAYSNGIYKSERLKAGINKVLNKAIAYTPGLSFVTQGSTHRIAGDFSVIVSNQADSDTAYAKILHGEWLMTNIVHMFLFDKNQYMNNITCVKPHTYSPIGVDLESTA